MSTTFFQGIGNLLRTKKAKNPASVEQTVEEEPPLQLTPEQRLNKLLIQQMIEYNVTNGKGYHRLPDTKIRIDDEFLQTFLHFQEHIALGMETNVRLLVDANYALTKNGEEKDKALSNILIKYF